MKPMRHGNFFYLLVSLLLLILVTPVLTDLTVLPAGVVRAVGFSTVLAVGVWSLQGSRRSFLIGMFLAVVGIVVSLAATLFELRAYELLSMLAFVAFLIVAIIEALRKVIWSQVINANRVTGAVCVYLMLGLLWGAFYSVLHTISPDAFRLPAGEVNVVTTSTWNYYSFVTLTTLGYGEIVPVSATARTLAFAEAVTGQLYVAILVAGLVGAYIAEGQKTGDE